MEHRVFVTYDGLSPPTWIDGYLKDNFGTFGEEWWAQCVTDSWDNNTNCYYFKCKEQANKFEFIARLACKDCPIRGDRK